MKKTFQLMISLLLWIGVSLAPVFAQAYKNPVEAYGKLQTEGAYVIGSKVGIPVQVKGMSFFWNKSGWGGEGYWNTGEIDKMINEYKCEVLRFAVTTSTDGQYANANNIHSLVDYCISKGIYVILDFHSHQASSITQEAKDFFSNLAGKYGNNDNVIFEIWNEPIGTPATATDTWKDIKNYANQVIQVIRAKSNNLIIVGTPHYSQFVNEAVKDPITGYENIAYVFHFYSYSHKIGGWEYDQMKQAFGKLPLFCSEWGVSHSDGGNSVKTLDLPSADQWWKLMDDYKISSCMWSIMGGSQSSAIYSGSGSGDYIKGKLNAWRNVAPWVTGDLIPKPLVANAGVDQKVILPKIELLLQASQTGGKQPFTYAWVQESGPNTATITNGTQQIAKITNLVAGDYLFKVTIGCTNDQSTDQVAVKVYPEGYIPDGMIDNFADNDIISVWMGLWSTYNDGSNGGTTAINPVAQLVSNGAAKATYTMHKGANLYDPYCGVRVSLKDDGTAYDLTGCNYITYDYKGDAHQFRFEQADITDGAFYKIEVEASAVWTSVTLDISKFEQPGWTTQTVARNIKIVKSLSWQVGKADGQAGTLELDNVACYGATPPVKPTPDPKFTSGTNSLALPSQIVATFDKALAAINQSDKSSFSISVNGSIRTIESISGSGSTITLKISGVVAEDEVISISYTKGQVKDAQGNLMLDFSNKSVTNLLKSTPAIGRLLADAEGDGKTAFGTSWEIATAGATAGSASASPLELVSDGADNTQKSAKMAYTLGNDSWQVANLGFYLSTNKTAYDLSTATGIGFWHKGSACKAVIHLSSNTSDNLHKAAVDAHSQWTWVELPWSNFLQESGWGTIVNFDPKVITKMKWEVNAAGTTGVLQVDQVWALGMAELSNKKSLNSKIAQVEAIISSGVFGVEAGDYPVGSKLSLTTILATAKGVSLNLAAQQAEVDLATTNISKVLFDTERARLDVAISVSTAFLNSAEANLATDVAKKTFSDILQNANLVISSATSIDLIIAETNKVIDGLKVFKQNVFTTILPNSNNKVVSRVYPNPCSGVATVETNDLTSTTIAIYSGVGQNVTSLVDVTSNISGTWTIVLTALPEGLYFVKTDNSCSKFLKIK